MHRQLVTVDNQTSKGTIAPQELFNLVWALDYQAHYHYGRSPWVNAERAPQAQVVALPEGAKPPVGAWNLILLDTTDQEGALGYHDDVEGTEIPYTDVFVKTAREYGDSPSAVASHELLEMLVDPYVNKPRTARHAGKLYIMEICDAVQGEDYDVGEPQGVKTGTMVANFVNPAYYGLPQPADPHAMSFRPGEIVVPFSIAKEGYISTAPEDDPTNWTPEFGEHKRALLAAGKPVHEVLPPWASRLKRIHDLPTAA